LAVLDVDEIHKKERGDEDGASELEDELFPGFEAVTAAVAGFGGEFEPVIDAAESAEPENEDEGLLDEGVVELCPKQSREYYSQEDNEAAHCGGVGFLFGKLVESGVVKFGSVADFFGHKPANDARAEEYSDNQGSQKRGDSAEGDFLIGVKAEAMSKNVPQKPQNVVNHFYLD
jgi:hypothetical protein